MKATCPTVSFPEPQWLISAVIKSIQLTRIPLILIYNSGNPNKTNTFPKITLSLKCSVLLFSVFGEI